jgi:hypothetical protein
MSTDSTTKNVVPSILGGIASFLSPWFESWKERRNHRRELIALIEIGTLGLVIPF